MNFLKSFGTWAAFTCLPPLVLYLRAPQFRRIDVLFFIPFFLIPAIGCIALWMPLFRLDTPKKGVLAGILLGLFVPILGGLVWMRIYPGFESQPAIFLGALMITVPSALGGGVAGWLRTRSKRQPPEASVGPDVTP
jgi:cytochrome bd-type quinol oxidase subunit 1